MKEQNTSYLLQGEKSTRNTREALTEIQAKCEQDGAQGLAFLIALLQARIYSLWMLFVALGYPDPDPVSFSLDHLHQICKEMASEKMAPLRGKRAQRVRQHWHLILKYTCFVTVLERVVEAQFQATANHTDPIRAGLKAFIKNFDEMPAIAAGICLAYSPFEDERTDCTLWLAGHESAHIRLTGKKANRRLIQALQREYPDRIREGLRKELPSAVTAAWAEDPRRTTLDGFTSQVTRWIEDLRPEGPNGLSNVSLDTPIEEGSETTLRDVLQNKAVSSLLSTSEFDPLQQILMREDQQIRQERERQQNELLQKIVTTLSPRQREVYFLSKAEKLSCLEIAARLGIKITTVQTHLTTAQTKISRITKK
jgi:RNA polymerase sigma factor (sigma-70 family)